MPDPTLSVLQPYTSEKTGCKCTRSLPTKAPQKIKTLLTASLAHDGPKIFNSLPKEVSDITACTVNTFKTDVDGFLGSVSDEPSVPDYTARSRTSTSIPAQLELMNREVWVESSAQPPPLPGIHL